jgi:opacity protein-like surface antigen
LPENTLKHGLILSLLLLAAPATHAATPIDGWYSNVFAGYAYVPDNINTTRGSTTYTNANYESEYNAGGSFGFKSNPMRYEGQVTYLNAALSHVYENSLKQTEISGHNNAFFGLVNVYYDFPDVIQTISPFLGLGLGYGWIDMKINNKYLIDVPDFSDAGSAFAYQGSVGLTFNFAENYALNIGYRYIGTNRVFAFDHIFQAHLANISAIYRYEEARYK